MDLSTDILKDLAVFHLANQSATWEDLRAHTLTIADRVTVDSSLTAYDRILQGIAGELDGQQAGTANTHVNLSLSVNTQPDLEPITFSFLADLYMSELRANVQPSTMHEVTTSCKVIAMALGELDMRTHTRADMVSLKEKLLETRKGSTVNKLLTRLSTVMTWAVNTGHLDKTYDKGLKLTKGADSSREAFSQDQIATLMIYANGLPADSWKRWALSLGVLTGARIGEVYQLAKGDVKQIGDVWVIDINADNGKTLKNKHSARVVPLVDGAFGFNLEAFLEFVKRCGSDRLFTAKAHYFNKPLNEMIREVLKLESGGDLSFHSLRHFVAGSLKAAEVPLGTAQEILGHSSGSITFDLYGAGRAVQVVRLAEALRGGLLVD
ncbi:site-specific integrase [Pseudomonas sp. MWU12-2037]|uniref:site-specific integrase n=1 Tax=Pseudomonas sp. MWU12-2037 TaxID=2928690 RepID=UPI0032C4884E